MSRDSDSFCLIAIDNMIPTCVFLKGLSDNLITRLLSGRKGIHLHKHTTVTAIIGPGRHWRYDESRSR
ncbi:protein of unknown function [Kyrpidia spormannii]|uniref:Uncharacterized protein n=1 Tax=Kyrpidia spormannii TaxID=2055160 RepID=A0ACA8Z7V3_9BACL|nr:protein of unknown function [Kyrpidia spormannii]